MLLFTRAALGVLRRQSQRARIRRRTLRQPGGTQQGKETTEGWQAGPAHGVRVRRAHHQGFVTGGRLSKGVAATVSLTASWGPW